VNTGSSSTGEENNFASNGGEWKNALGKTGLRNHPRHAPDDARGLILCENDTAASANDAASSKPVGTHSSEHNTQHTRAEGR
jgi:hypothetical protein